MDDYLRYLECCMRKIKTEEKEFCCCFILKSKDEVIMKEVWHDKEEHQEIKCPLHNSLSSKENIQRLEDKLESRDIQSLPKCVHLRKSSTVGNEYGVWSNMEIPKGVRFGPYEGITLNEEEADQSGYSWKILEDKDIGCFVDVKNDNETNWLKYLNFPPHQGQQNLIILQHSGQIYYETVRDIAPDTELLVWCRNESAPLVGTERKDAEKPNRQLSPRTPQTNRILQSPTTPVFISSGNISPQLVWASQETQDGVSWNDTSPLRQQLLSGKMDVNEYLQYVNDKKAKEQDGSLLASKTYKYYFGTTE